MIALGSDHVGYVLKQEIIRFLEDRGFDYRDFGTDSQQRCDYPVFAKKAADAVASGACDKGIILCGTGVGISIAANKVHGIRCVVCSEPYSAKLSREHNDSNMLAMGAKVVGTDLALMILEAWLTGEYQGGRHQKRLDMITAIENTAD